MRRTTRVIAVTLLAASTCLWLQRGAINTPERCTVLSQDVRTMSGCAVSVGGVLSNLAALQRILHKISESVPDKHGVSVNRDQSWQGAAMHHWVDRAGATASAESLEAELQSLQIGRKPVSDPKRSAMKMRRLERQASLERKRQEPRMQNSDTGMKHWVDRAGAVDPPAKLESELMSLKIGGRSGDDERRKAMHLKRVAREKELGF